MSHTTELKTIKIIDIKALEDAVKYIAKTGIDIELVRDAKPRMYYRSQEVKCDYVVKLPDIAFDIGFVKQEDGSYHPIFDAHAGYVRSQVGAPYTVKAADYEDSQTMELSKLIDLYGIHAAKNQLEQEGYGYGAEIAYNSADDSYTLEVTSGY